LKQSTVSFPSCNGPMNPCLNMKFDELEDGHACYNPYARQDGFSIRQNHSRLSKEDKSLIGV
jgi:hypothetical protein